MLGQGRFWQGQVQQSAPPAICTKLTLQNDKNPIRVMAEAITQQTPSQIFCGLRLKLNSTVFCYASAVHSVFVLLSDVC